MFEKHRTATKYRYQNAGEARRSFAPMKTIQPDGRGAVGMFNYDSLWIFPWHIH
jgi:hypothetical protein